MINACIQARCHAAQVQRAWLLAGSGSLLAAVGQLLHQRALDVVNIV
jgi:hypothetical protein